MRKAGKKLISLAMAAVLTLGLAACGGKDSDTQTTAGETGTKTETSAGTETGSSSTDGEEKVMRFGSTGYFATETLDPGNGWDGWYLMYSGVTETLFKLDETITPVPNLALSCESDNYKDWTITLRDDVTFQNGEKMTAEAVKACLERTYETNERAKEQMAMDSIEADGQTLTIHLTGEDVALKNTLTDPLWSIYDAANSDYETTLYCTGPYMVTEFEPFVETVVKRYDGYWGGMPKLSEAHLITISDTESLSMALQNNEIDMAVAMPTSAISTFENNDDYVIDAVTTSRGNRMYYNMDHEAMKDPAVRQAIAMCIDREGVSRTIYNGKAEASWGLFPSFLPYGGTDGLTLTVDKYDPEGAAKLLAEAGWSDSDGDGILDKAGVKLELKAITFASRKELAQMLELLQAELGTIGIKLNVEVMESTADAVKAGEYDLDCETGVMVPTGNPQYFINLMLVTGASSNYSHYSNAKLDELAKTLSGTADEAERIDLVRQMVQMVLDDNAMTVYNHQMMTNIYTSAVKGFSTHPSEYYLLDVNTDIER